MHHNARLDCSPTCGMGAACPGRWAGAHGHAVHVSEVGPLALGLLPSDERLRRLEGHRRGRSKCGCAPTPPRRLSAYDPVALHARVLRRGQVAGRSKPRKLQVHASVSGLDHERVSLGCHAACDGRRGACNGASAHRAAAIPSALTRRWASAAAAACVLAARRLCQRVWPALLLPDSPAASLPAKEVAVGSSLAGPLARARFGSGLQRRRAPRHTWMLSGRSCRTACTALSNAACHERASSSLSKPWHVR